MTYSRLLNGLTASALILIANPSSTSAQDLDSVVVETTSENTAAVSDAETVEETGTLDVTVVESTPAPVTAPTVRRATVSRPVEIEVYDTIETDIFDGGAEATAALPGSGFFITSQDIRDQNYVNVNRILAKVPGVYVREEDGAGLFPNISIRGVDGTRSEKVTIMEDGILQAPAPYAAPSAYYSPNVGRMAGVEILKGSSQVKYGPHTTGGVINYLSTPIPEHEQFYSRTTYGSNNTVQAHFHYGDTLETKSGKIGYLAEIYTKRSDGFRTIDAGNGIPASDNTGYQVIEPMVKLSWEPNTVLDQKVEFKYGFSDSDADETYLGLTETDFRANPYRRYAGSFLDNISTQQHRTYLKHSIALNEDLNVKFAGYYNNFERDWFKIRQVNGASLHTTLGPTGLPANLATLKGQAPGLLGYRHNARSYESYGVQASADYHIETGALDHTFEVGVREHKDNIRRFQENTNVTIGGAGTSPIIANQGPGSGGNRLQESNATAIWFQDKVKIGNLSITPGVRHERVELHNTDFASDATNTPTAVRNGEIDWWVAGIGLNYEFDESNSVFGGVYEGVSSPSPRSRLSSMVGLEESLGYELGFRHSGENFNAELVGFLTDFNNIISTAAGLGQGSTQNAGSGRVAGIEALASFDPNQGRDIRTPLFVSATYTDTTLDQALTAGGGEDIYGDGTGGPGIAGANLPYIPEWKITTGVGVETDQWGIDLTASYVSDTFGTALNSPVPVTSSRQGEVDGGVIVDLGAFYQLNPKTKFIGGVHNLFEEVMLSSRIPEGPRANAPREFYIGMEILWEPSGKQSYK